MEEAVCNTAVIEAMFVRQLGKWETRAFAGCTFLNSSHKQRIVLLRDASFVRRDLT